jgi:spectinomycin phosphotransferase
LLHALFAGWRLRVDSLEYLPEGGGSHHWKALDADGQPHFVTVDDLDNKDWMADNRSDAYTGLQRALEAAAALRHRAGLEFVVAPRGADDGRFLRRLNTRYTVSVYPFLTGTSAPFGPFTDRRLKGEVLQMIAVLHQSSAVVQGIAARDVLRFGGERDLRALLQDPRPQPWGSGPFSTRAHRLLTDHMDDLSRLLTAFDGLVQQTAARRRKFVVTHGEPHPGNVISVSGGLRLIDWDTVALAPPERDLSLLAGGEGDGVERYQQVTGRTIDPALITLYQLRWYLDDLASAVRLFSHPHRDTADTRRWWEGLPPGLSLLPSWLNRLDH